MLELPVAVYHPATLPPPPPEPYPYPAPDLFPNPHSPPPLGPIPNFLADRALSPPYAYPSSPPAIPLFPHLIPAPLSMQLVIPPFRAHDGQLWFPSPPPAYVGGPYQDQHPPPRPASTNVGAAQASVLLAGLPVSGTPDHLHKHHSYRQHQHYPPQPEDTTGHGARAARISHHLRATSRARSASPPAQVFPPTQVLVDVIAPKPIPSSEVITEAHDATDCDDRFARSSGGTRTRTRCLSVVKLEEMAARAAAEAEAKARAEKEGRVVAVDKTLPAPPVPSGKPSGYGAIRRVSAQDIFHQTGLEEETMERGETEAGTEIFPRTPSLSALSLLRPPQRHSRLAFPSYEEQMEEENGLDVLERRLAEQVGTRKNPPPDLHSVLELGSTSPLPPPPPVPAPVPVPGKSIAQEQADDVNSGAAVNESAISSLALGADEDFGGRNTKTTNPNIILPDVQVDGEEEAEGEDLDADGRTQRLGKGTGASSSSERGTYKARSRKSAKSDSREKERERRKSEGKAKRKKKRRDERDDDAARLRSAAKGRVAEWLGKLENCEPGPEPEIPEPEPDSAASPPEPEQEPASQTEPAPIAAEAIAAAPATSSPTIPSPVIESKPNPRSSGFIPVSTLRRAPISLPSESDSVSHASPEPPSSSNANDIPPPVPVHVRLAQKFPPTSQAEVKYDVKSARGGRGGRVTAVAAIWAEAAKSADSSVGASASASAGSGSGAATPTLTPSPAPLPRQARAARPAVAKGSLKAAQTKATAAAASIKVPMKRMTSIVDPVRAPPNPVPAKMPRAVVRQPPSVPAREKDSRPMRALFGLGAAAAATPSSPALSSSIATPVLSSTASLARPPVITTTTTAQPEMRINAPSPSSSPLRPAQTHPHPHHPSQPAPAPTAGQRPAIVNGGGFKAAELAFGQARLRDLIKRYQGQTA